MRMMLAFVLAFVTGVGPAWAAVWKDCTRTRSGIPFPTYERSEERGHALLEAAKHIVPRLLDGRVDPNWKTGSGEIVGRVVVVWCGDGPAKAIGGAFWQAFKPYAKPWVVFANLATNLTGTDEWGGPFDHVWVKTSLWLQNRGLSPSQVQVMICPISQIDPTHPTTADEIAQVCRMGHEKFPQLYLCLLTDRPYQGYSTRPGGGHTPHWNAVNEGQAMAWLAETQAGIPDQVGFDFIAIGSDAAPNAYAGDLAYPCPAVADDGSTPSLSGRAAIAKSLAERLRLDDVTFGWLR